MPPLKTLARIHGNASKLAVLFVSGLSLLAPQLLAQEDMQVIELAKRKAMVEEARVLVAQGDQALQEDKPADAVEAYAGARELLPDVPALKEMREAVTERYIVAALSQSAAFANRGDLKAANAMVDRILEKGVAPNNASALKMKKMLNNPVRIEPALTPQHHKNIKEVLRLIELANSAIGLGRYDLAAECYEDILSIDPHNVLARRGLMQVIHLKGESKIAAYDHTRAEMLYQVDKAWELSVRAQNEEPGQPIRIPVEEEPKDITVEAKLNRIMIPRVALDDVNLRDAIEFLRVSSASQDLMTVDQAKRGINFTINLGPEDSPIVQGMADKRFDLRLQEVPVVEVLKYITELTGTAYKVDPYAVTIIPRSQVTDEVFMRTYSVPPDFISALSEDAGGGVGETDPFAVAEPTQGLIQARLPVQELLQRKGIPFGDGASASYSAATNQLIFVNTADNHSLVQQIIDIIKDSDPIVISVQVTMIKAQQQHLEELGFDWLLNPYRVNRGDLVSLTGGTPGNTLGRTWGDFSNVLPPTGGPDATAPNVITNGLRSGDRAFVVDNIDDIINNPTRSAQASRVAPGIMAMTGVFSDGAAQVIMRGLDQKTGIDTMARPSVVTRNGESARITLAREFIYPTEYDPPELQQGGGGNNNFGGGGGGRGPAFPVVPANPTAFETRDVGINLEVLPVADENKQFISVTLNPEIVEFDGFVNYGSPITVPVEDVFGGFSRVTLTENQILMPVFSTKRAVSQLTVQDGATVVFGGLLTQSVESVEDKVPVLGDIPVLGRMFSSKSHLPVSTAIIFMVKVDLMDATGRPYRELGNP